MIRQFISVLCLLAMVSCQPGSQSAQSENSILPATWEGIVEQAKGQQVQMMMWTGDPLINAYMKEYVVPEVKNRYGIDLDIASGQGNILVQVLQAELEAGKKASELDLVWINGETFYQLRQINGLHGPFTDRLPNSQYIDFENQFIGQDFQQPTEGYECPWGNVQMTWIYNSKEVADPPQNREELAAFVKANPGKFTFDTHFTGLTFLKALLIDIAGGKDALNGPFDEAKYTEHSKELWAYLKSIQPYLWKKGETFPESVAPMHQMFANGELWFTMSNNDSEVDNKVAQGVFPPMARAYVWEPGTIQNSHFLGIPHLSGKKAAAMVVVNFMISPEAQYRKRDPLVWGDGTVLATEKLPDEWQEKFQQVPNRRYAPLREEIQDRALMELAPEYMIRLASDFRKEML
ncbi:MAG: ABC transporter substrate-binding protein [Bacteroidota bacterium]